MDIRNKARVLDYFYYLQFLLCFTERKKNVQTCPKELIYFEIWTIQLTLVLSGFSRCSH